MKFIFPQNYRFNTKLFGLLDYPTAIFNFIWWIIIFLITKLLFTDLLTKIIFFIIACFPVLLISLFGFHQENIIYVFYYLFIFLKSHKIYLYRKE
jgi:hypothetical protein